MPCWRQDGEFVFGDYIKVEEADKGFDQILKKYNVQLALIPNTPDPTAKEEMQNQKNEEISKKYKFLSYVLGISARNDLRQELIKLGWKTIYKDDTAVILERK